MHDVLLLESRSHILKYASNQKRKLLKKTEELNRKIDEKAESIEHEDIEMVNFMKLEVQNLEDEKYMAAARKCFVRGVYIPKKTLFFRTLFWPYFYFSRAGFVQIFLKFRI